MDVIQLAAELPVGFERYHKNAVTLLRQVTDYSDEPVELLSNLATTLIVQGAISNICTLTDNEGYDDQAPFYEEMCDNLEGMEEGNNAELYQDVIAQGTGVMYALARDLRDKGFDGGQIVNGVDMNWPIFKAEIWIEEDCE